MYRVCSPVSPRAFINIRLSQNPQTQKRLFHVSNTSFSRKIDPSRYPLHQNINLETIQQFRRMEDKLENNQRQDITKEELKQFIKEKWPNKDRDIDKLKEGRIPSPLPEQYQKAPDPLVEPLDLNRDADFAKALGYFTTDQSFVPTKEHYEEVLAEESQDRFPVNEVLKVRRHTHVTAGGRVFSFSALVLIGTGKGTAGLGYARGNTVIEAVNLAKTKAEKNLISIDLWRGYHIGVDIQQRYKKSFVWFRARRPGTGRSAGFNMLTFLDAFGIQDVILGHGGSRNVHTKYRALFLALRDKTRNPEKVSRMLGRKLFNRAGAYYHTTD